MLEQLTIKNVAVIDKLSVDFSNGLSVLTGETGAGKSIIIDSINMILGDRAKKELIRNGTDYAYVEAVFSMDNAVAKILADNDIDSDDDSIIISRKITAEGKSTARINGCAVTLNTLRDISDMLINIHGQHDNQALLTPQKHIAFLDAFLGTDDMLATYRGIYEKRNELKRQLSVLQTNTAERIQRADLLSYQVNEINTANLQPDEEQELILQRNILERAEEITESVNHTVGVLYDSDSGASAYDMISEAQSALSKIADVDSTIAEAYETITSALYSIEEASRTVRDFGSNVEFDEQALDEITERIDLIGRLKRKYGSTITDVIEYGRKAEAELVMLDSSDERANEISAELEIVEARLKSAADMLSNARKEAGEILSRAIKNALSELNMEKSDFDVMITDKPYANDGKDDVEFVIRTNPGEPMKPLVKIASGGELSRVMLAIKSVLAKTDGVNTMIFDEIDTGVSGSAAQKIADKLKMISKDAQVICITHLPQLASSADTHFLIEKDIEGEMAKTTLAKLDRDGRIAELARIVGGGEAGLEYAKKII